MSGSTWNEPYTVRVFDLQIRIEGVLRDDPGAELARMLRRLADRVEDADLPTEEGQPTEEHPVLDVNGNTAGRWRLADRWLLPEDD